LNACKCILSGYEFRKNTYDPYARSHAGATLKRVDGVARAMSRSRAWVINQAVERYIDYEEWFVAEVKEALKEVRAGAVVEHEAVMRQWERKRAGKMDARR
jgi:predicted transcriptional regulator